MQSLQKAQRETRCSSRGEYRTCSDTAALELMRIVQIQLSAEGRHLQGQIGRQQRLMSHELLLRGALELPIELLGQAAKRRWVSALEQLENRQMGDRVCSAGCAEGAQRQLPMELPLRVKRQQYKNVQRR